MMDEGRYARDRDIHTQRGGAAVPRPSDSLLECYAIVPEADLIWRAANVTDPGIAERLRRMAGYGGLGRHTGE
jgi:hypothetical protein